MRETNPISETLSFEEKLKLLLDKILRRESLKNEISLIVSHFEVVEMENILYIRHTI